MPPRGFLEASRALKEKAVIVLLGFSIKAPPPPPAPRGNKQNQNPKNLNPPIPFKSYNNT
jgi:hypothetical protein